MYHYFNETYGDEHRDEEDVRVGDANQAAEKRFVFRCNLRTVRRCRGTTTRGYFCSRKQRTTYKFKKYRSKKEKLMC